ncbi:MAG: N-acetyl-gamma-glutamyl-phosphate reductase [Acidimicrobiaceae bacterium]|nr:N-acetyl-gamma-glutamyl-phosphate reductase [Acidimicrobiaceae bacterium]|tara:strand:+ start:4419 stop:5453 length:1035 start_codon:yes stop_codon:yes gene_type:complete
MSSNAGLQVGIVGASGFTGSELMRLIATHPDMELVVATGDTQAGSRVRDLYPNLAAEYSDLVYSEYSASELEGLDAVFLGLPHMASQPIVSELFKKVGCILDLGSDFRLKDPNLYPQWYGDEHSVPELLDHFVYGLPEIFRSEMEGARGIAVPGCYPTAASLALYPFVAAGKVEQTGVIVDAASGVSGAGRAAKANTTFASVDENFNAYGLLTHRHTPEIEQVSGCEILFTPHLAPMVRGILATCYARPIEQEFTTEDALDILRQFYCGEPFVVVDESSPSTKATTGSNTVHLTARVDERTGWLLVISALDNLVKGASGGAIQCANIALGLEETTGLPAVGLMP